MRGRRRARQDRPGIEIRVLLQELVIWLNVGRKWRVDWLCVEHSAKYFEGRKFDTTSTRLLHFVTTDHFSMEKMLYRFAFVLWHLWLPEWDEPRRFWW